MQRLAKVISNAGICSRRDAEELITQGLVKVDGIVINSPAINISENNKVEVQGKLLDRNQEIRLWLYYKPVGLITTHKDPQHRKTVFETIEGLPRVISIGRLDLNSEGLLLLTNNGDLARKFELPSNKIKRIYRVRAHGNPYSLLRSNCRDLKINNINYCLESIKLIQRNTTNSWFEVVLTEGKNREIRKIFEYFNLQVSRLIRIQYGDFILGNLKPGEYTRLI